MTLRTRFFPRVLWNFTWPAIALVLLLLLRCSGTARGESTLSWQEYWRLVDLTGQKVSLAERSPTQAPALLKDLADRWNGITHVSLPGGEQMVVNPGVLVDQLEQDPPDWQSLHELLARMKASQSRESLATFTEQDAQSVQTILARPEYNWPDDSQQNPLQRFLAGLLQKIVDFLNRLFPPGKTSGNLFLPILYTSAVFLILLLVLYFSFRGIFGELVHEAGLEKAGGGEEVLTAAQARQRAHDLAENGDPRQAVRYLYLSGLLQLEERGLLRYDRSRTNREYLRSIQEHPQLALILKDVIEVFDRVWYGYRKIDKENYAKYVEQVNRLKEQK